MGSETNINMGQGNSFIDQSLLARFDEEIQNVQQLKELNAQLGLSDSISKSEQKEVPTQDFVMEFPKPEAPPEGTPSQLNPEMMWSPDANNEQLYMNSLQQSFDKIAAGPPPMTENQKLELNFALQWGPGAPVSTATANLAQLVMENVRESLLSESESPNSLLPSSSDYKKFKENLAKISSTLFENNIQKAVQDGKLSPEQAKQILFGRNNPEFADASIKKLLSQFEDSTSAQLQEIYGVPMDARISPNTTKFNQELTANFSNLVGQNLENMAKELGLSSKQVAELKFMHAHPEINFPGKGDLQGILNKAELQALNSIKNEFGIPSNFKPKPDTALFDSISQGFFNDELANQVENFLKNDKSVTDENLLLTRNLLNFAIANPNNPGVPPEIQAIAQELIASSWGKVGGDLGIPPGALAPPPTGPLTGGSLDAGTALQTRNGINVVNGQMSIANSLVLSLPEGPAKGFYMNFLKTISAALSSLKEFLYTLESTDAEISKKNAIAKRDAKLNQLKEEAKMMKEMEGKLAKMGVATTAVTVITAVITAIMAIPIIGQIIAAALAPLQAGLLAATVAATATMAAGQGSVTATVQAAMQLIAQSIKTVVVEVAKAAFQVIKEALKEAFKEMIKVLSKLLSKEAVTNIAKGAAAMAKEVVSGSKSLVEGIISALKEVVRFLETLLKAGAERSMKPIIEFFKEMFNSTLKFMQTARSMTFTEAINNKPFMDSIVLTLEKFSFQAEMVLGFSAGIVGGMKAINQVEIVMLQAEMDEMREMVQALIKALQKVIDNFMKGLATIGEQAADVTKLLNDIFAKQSHALTALTQA